MHSQSKRPPALDDDAADSAVLGLLLQGLALWAVEEVARQVGDETTTTDALARLYGSGLVHRIDRFVFATRAAVEHDRIAS